MIDTDIANLELKSKIIGTLKRYQEFENELFQNLEQTNSNAPPYDSVAYLFHIQNVWIQKLRKNYYTFLGILSDLKIIPGVEKRREYRRVEIHCNKIDDETYSECIDILTKIPRKFRELRSYIKKEFLITEADILNKKVEEASNPLSSASIENKSAEVKPKHVKELEELEALHKELTSKSFLKRQVDTMRDVMDSISKDAGLILQIELFKGNLTEENREFLNTTYRIKDNLKNMPGEVQPDEATEKTIREYSFDLKSFIKRQRENRGIA